MNVGFDHARDQRRLDLLGAGAKVFVGGDVRAYVTAVMIRGPLVQYEAVWFDGCDRHEAWFEEHEIRPDDGVEPSLEIGFHVPGQAAR